MKLVELSLAKAECKSLLVRTALTDEESKYLQVIFKIEQNQKLLQPDVDGLKSKGIRPPHSFMMDYYYIEWYNTATKLLEALGRDRSLHIGYYGYNQTQHAFPTLGDIATNIASVHNQYQITVLKTFSSIKEFYRTRGHFEDLDPHTQDDRFVPNLWVWYNLGFDVD